MKNGIGGDQDCPAAAGECQSNQAMAGDYQAGVLIWRDLNNAALAAQRARNVEISLGIESQPLRSPQAAVKNRDRTVRIDAVNRVKARLRRAGHVQSAVRGKGQVISRDAPLQRGENEYLAVRRDAPDRAAAIANVQVPGFIKGDASGDAHTFSIGAESAVGRHTVHGAIIAGRNVQLALRIKSQAGRIHQVSQERFGSAVAGVYLVNCHWDFLPATAGIGDIDIAIAINSGIRNRMKAFSNRLRDLEFTAVTCMSVAVNGDLAGLRAERHPGDQKIF